MKYVFLDDPYDIGHVLMRDLENYKDCFVMYRNRLSKNRFLNRFLGKRVYNWLKKLSLSRLWYRIVFRHCCGPDTRVIAISIYWFDMEMVDYLKTSYPKAKLVFLLRDTVLSKTREVEGFSIDLLKKKFDLILSYDIIHDVPVYGLTYAPVFISKFDEITSEPTNYKYDITLIASAKDRLKTIHGLYQQLESNGVKSFFYISHSKVSDQLQGSNIIYGKYNMRRMDFLKKEMESNCILEVLKGDAYANTLRFWEAIMYNKKLYTNWKDAVNSPYFDPRYIKVYNTYEDLDISFIKERIKVEYNYGGELSPINMLYIFKKEWGFN